MGWGWNDFVETVSNVANTAINIGTNTVTGGMLGYNPNDGGFTPNAGYAGRIIDEVSGAGDRREDEYTKRVAADAAAAQQKLIDDQNEQRRLADVNASNSARAIRSTAQIRSGNFGSSISSSDERDFLGL